MFCCPQNSTFVIGGEIPTQFIGEFPELLAVQQLADVHRMLECKFRNDFGDAPHQDVPAPGDFQIIQLAQGGEIFVDDEIGVCRSCPGKKIVVLDEFPDTLFDFILFRLYPSRGRKQGPVIIST
jgi:hypothetical protein